MCQEKFKISFLSLSVKFPKKLDVHAVLASDLLTQYEKSDNGNPTRIYTPICVVHLSGEKHEKKTIHIPSGLGFEFRNTGGPISLWLQTFKREQINVELNVHFCFWRVCE